MAKWNRSGPYEWFHHYDGGAEVGNWGGLARGVGLNTIIIRVLLLYWHGYRVWLL
jgi:hypothetical protein